MSNGEDLLPPDDPLARTDSELDRLGIPASFFQTRLDDAIADATGAGRQDGLAATRPWVALGPRNIGGRIQAIAQDPRNASILYCGSGFGGVWKTVNAGDTWTPLDNFSPPAVRQALPIGAIAVAPTNTQIVYVGTGEPIIYPSGSDSYFPGQGLYRSADGGATFALIDDINTGTIRSARYQRILVDPWEADRYWLCCPGRGLYRHRPAPANDFVQDIVEPGAVGTEDPTDIAIDFGDRSAVLPPATFRIFAALRGKGIFRSTFTRATQTYSAWTKLTEGLDESDFRRVRITMCQSVPTVLYAAFAVKDEKMSRVYRSATGGDRWEKTSTRPGDDGKIAWYGMVLEVHPDRPEIVYAGTVDLFRSLDGGENWAKVIDWTNYDKGNRSLHGDQHALVFDRVDPRKIWSGNDGGLSMSRNLGHTWRKRSHGILAAQFYDITVHPKHPFIMGGGLQDNGTWVGYGGPTWYRLHGGDGGAIGFEPTDPRRFHVTTQNGPSRANVIDNPAQDSGSHLLYRSPVPDAEPPPLNRQMAVEVVGTDGFASDDKAVFVAVLVHHPTRANEAIVARERAAYRTTNGINFQKLPLPAFQKVPPANTSTPEASALAYGTGAAATTDIWVGTSQGELFNSTDDGATWPVPAAPPPPATGRAIISGNWISRIVVHPTNSAIVAVATAGGTGRVYLSPDRGATFRDISSAGSAANQICPGPVTSLAFDPQSSPNVATAQTLYAGTLAGVYVCRNVIPNNAAPAAQWQAFNGNLPLVLVHDLTAFEVRDAGNAIIRTGLRAGTFGRGIYECDLAGTADVRLLIRRNVVDDGRTYFGDALVNDDPRLPLGRLLVYDKAIDIRVDAPPFSFFEERLDGAEFDEDLVNDALVAGERNFVYVQVHNTGSATVNGVDVNLYFANSPGQPPDLQADFWAGFPNPPAGGPWERAGFTTVDGLGPGQPVVARIDWQAPTTLAAKVALLAVCSHAQDPVNAGPPTLQMDPTLAAGLPRTERRAALRIVDVAVFTPDVFVRDGIDDDGALGAVAWGGRSSDIIVRQTAEADPDAAFTDLTDLRRGDKVKGGVTNFVYVRVHNRRSVPLNAKVAVMAVPFAKFGTQSDWLPIGGEVDVPNVPPKSSKFAPQIEWTGVVDPDASPTNPFKAYIVIAVVYGEGEPQPDLTAVTNLDTAWRFFLRADTANSTAMRGIRYEPP
jgi:photosystem II stability/assembly factor-like uncharacterized protein